MTNESHTMNANLHLGTKLHSDVEFQIKVEAHFDSKISIQKRDVELPEKDVHSNS